MRKSFLLILLLLLTISLWLLLIIIKKEDSTKYQQKSKVMVISKRKKQEETVGHDRSLIKILFTGDLMFDRHIREIAQAKGNDFILEDIKNLLIEEDLVITNLEGPITNYNSVSVNTEIGV